jgi:predicted RNA-binding Zn-ribbon protein involved in translation (DUF1610 family)
MKAPMQFVDYDSLPKQWNVAGGQRWNLGFARPNTAERKRCDECGSDYIAASSQMMQLCPECVHHLYGYPKCAHAFDGNRCSKCGWDGSRSDYIQRLIGEADR